MDSLPERRICSNCGSAISLTYCSACGQKWFDPERVTVLSLLKELAQKLLSVDSRWLRTIVPLLIRPGFLTKEYLAGRQRRYVKPLSLFITVNVLFFLFGHRMGVMRWNMWNAFGEQGRTRIAERAAQLNVDATAYIGRLNDVLLDFQRSFFFGVILVFAVLLFLLSWRRRRGMVGCLIYSIHFHASYLLLFPLVAFGVILIVGLADRLMGTAIAPFLGRDPGIGYIALTVMCAYHVVALRNAFNERWHTSLILAVLLTIGGGLLMVPVGQTVLFWLVLAVAG